MHLTHPTVAIYSKLVCFALNPAASNSTVFHLMQVTAAQVERRLHCNWVIYISIKPHYNYYKYGTFNSTSFQLANVAVQNFSNIVCLTQNHVTVLNYAGYQ